jgi:antitoxin component YwqK of YwqJK toxin-antitoxin module
MRIAIIALAGLALAGCKKRDDARTPPSPDMTSSGFPTRSPKKKPVEVPAQVRPVVARWWEDPGRHCPPGTQVYGELPPEGTGVWCGDDDYVRNGPRTNFHKNGQKSSEGWEVDSEWVGPWKHWHENGQLAREEVRLPGGGLTGSYRQWAEDGTLIGGFELPGGTGHATLWTPDGRKHEEGRMERGRRIGVWKRFHTDGSLAAEETYDGDREGPVTHYDPQGRKRVTGHHAAGEMHGRWSYFDPDSGDRDRVDVYDAGRKVREVFYQDGAPLGIDPPANRCDTDDGVAAVMGWPADRRAGACIQRPLAFPGVVLVGAFAHDRGCMPLTTLIDCKRIDGPRPARDILERAGWKDSMGAHREALALRYIQQVAVPYHGSVARDPDPPTARAAADGSVVAEVWVNHPSGMVRGRRADKIAYRFTPDGDLERTIIDEINEQR